MENEGDGALIFLINRGQVLRTYEYTCDAINYLYIPIIDLRERPTYIPITDLRERSK